MWGPGRKDPRRKALELEVHLRRMSTQAVRTWVAKRRSAPRPVNRHRLQQAIRARKSVVLALALLWVMVGFTLDDAKMLRFPSYLLGAVMAIVTLAIGPMWLGRRLVVDYNLLDDESFEAAAGRSRRMGALLLLVSALAFLGWLAIFSAGVPPWAR